MAPFSEKRPKYTVIPPVCPRQSRDKLGLTRRLALREEGLETGVVVQFHEARIDPDDAEIVTPQIDGGFQVGERPVLVVELHAGESCRPDVLLGCLKGKVASWWIPDIVVHMESMPLAATGKIDKNRLRAIMDVADSPLGAPAIDGR